jgi:dienelactone hydrolase
VSTLPDHPSETVDVPAEARVLDHESAEDPRDMVLRYLRSIGESAFERRRNAYEELDGQETIADRTTELREWFRDAIGGLPDRTPLSPHVTDSITCDGYTIDLIHFESHPGVHVTGALYRPSDERFEPPYPGVLVPCGHSIEGKAGEPYQKAPALFARNGIVAFVFDPIGQGERTQSRYPEESGGIRPTERHNRLNVGEMLVGRNLARTMVWDGIRSLDYLETIPEVDSTRLGCAGVSGGGMQTAYLTALDDRIEAASPVGYIKSYERRLLQGDVASDAEQNVHRQVAYGLLDEELLLMAAPTPILIGLSTGEGNFSPEGTWEVFRAAKRRYGALGCPERIELAEASGQHGWPRPLREASVHWLVRWLREEDRTVTEAPDLSVLPEERLQATPDGRVRSLEGHRSPYERSSTDASTMEPDRATLWDSDTPEDPLDLVRNRARIRPLVELPTPSVDVRNRRRRDVGTVESLVFETEPGISLPAFSFVPERRSTKGPILWLHQDGKHAEAGGGGAIEEAVESGRRVLTVDLRGTGETRQDRFRHYDGRFGTNWSEAYGAYRLGRSFVGMRTEDLLVTARWLQTDADEPVTVRATGDLGIPALHAVALEPDQFEALDLIDPPTPWSDVVGSPEAYPIENVVPGALQTYDLPDLEASLEDSVRVEAGIRSTDAR